MRRFLDVVEVLGLASVALGAGLLSVPWGLIVAGVLAVGWAALRDER